MTTDARIASVERATQRSWDEWLRFMDRIGAQDLDHRTIALRVQEELDGTVEGAGWWAQSVTVAYEQHIGRRVPGQRSDGTFQCSVSRSTTLVAHELMERWQQFAAADPGVRAVVADGTPRLGGSDRRVTWRSRARDGSSVVVTSEPRRSGTAAIVAVQTGLPTVEANEEARQRWTAIVGRFLDTL